MCLFQQLHHPPPRMHIEVEQSRMTHYCPVDFLQVRALFLPTKVQYVKHGLWNMDTSKYVQLIHELVGVHYYYYFFY